MPPDLAAGDDAPDHVLAREAARTLLDQGRRSIPTRGKVPWDVQHGRALDGWQALRLTEAALADYWRPGITGMGVLLGEPSGGLVDVDLDCPEALAAAAAYLPATGCVFGRASAPRSHHAYVADPLVGTLQLRDTDGTMLVELRSTGAQTVWPGSRHVESGERVRYDADGEPARVGGRELRRAVQYVAACALLARHWPAEGARHDTALALAGCLLRGGLEEPEGAGLVETAARIAGDPEWRDRVTAVRTTAAALAAGRPTTGGPTLAGLLPDGVVVRLGEWLGLRRAPDGAAPADAPVSQRLSRSLATILADPAALEPPAVVVPRLAWRGRTTLLAAREKTGKSTLATAAAAAASRGIGWLGDPTPAGIVLWLALEEHVADLAARLVAWGAEPARVHVVTSLAGAADPLAALLGEARRVGATLAVVDTLSALVDALGSRPDPGSATAWTPIMAGLTRLARETDAGVLILHHARRSDGEYRDSSAIGAGVDVIAEMREGEDATVRTLRVRARWRVGDYAIRLAGDRYVLASGELSLDARVLLHVEAHPGCSQRAVEQAIGGRAADVRAAIRRLLDSGAVRDAGEGGGMRLYGASQSASRPPSGDPPGTHSGTHSSPPHRVPPDPHETQAGRTGTHSGRTAGRTADPPVRPAPPPQRGGAGRGGDDAVEEIAV